MSGGRRQMHASVLQLLAPLLLITATCCNGNGGGMQDMVSAALQYLNSGGAPLPGSPPVQAPAPARSLSRAPIPAPAVRNITGTSSLLQSEPSSDRTRVSLPVCSDFSNLRELPGTLTDLHWHCLCHWMKYLHMAGICVAGNCACPRCNVSA